MAGEDAGKEPGRSAGVAELEHIGRLAAAADAETAHTPQTRFPLMRDLGPQCPEGRGGRQYVLALEQAAHRRLAQGQGAQHEGAMGRRFIARRPHAALQSPHRMGDKLGRMSAERQGNLPERRRKCDAAISYHGGIWF